MVSINFEGAKQFYAKQPDKTAAQAAFDTLVNGTGAGNDFIGWVDLPAFRLRQRRSSLTPRRLSSLASAAAISARAPWSSF